MIWIFWPNDKENHYELDTIYYNSIVSIKFKKKSFLLCVNYNRPHISDNELWKKIYIYLSRFIDNIVQTNISDLKLTIPDPHMAIL